MKAEDFIGKKVEYDQYGGTFIWGENKKGDLEMILDIRLRGWRTIQHLFKDTKEAEEFQDEVGEWIADAINQKLNKQ